MDTQLALILAILGVGVGTLGTIIGAGGGFLLVPALLFLFPRESPAALASVSLAAVFCNGLSGSVAYARQGRVDYKSVLLFSAVALPGATLGALATRYLPRAVFAAIFGVLLVAVAAYLVLQPRMGSTSKGWKQGWTVRELEDRYGQTYMYSFSARWAAFWNFAIGFVSNLLGIGGGIVQVPVLLRLHFPLHIATATSHAVLVVTSLIGVIVHMSHGEYAANYQRTILLAASIVVGAQIGARLSERLRTALLLRLMALALAIAGARLLAGVALGG
jgi:uncharacterized membrane protein YfcA